MCVVRKMRREMNKKKEVREMRDVCSKEDEEGKEVREMKREGDVGG